MLFFFCDARVDIVYIRAPSAPRVANIFRWAAIWYVGLVCEIRFDVPPRVPFLLGPNFIGGKETREINNKKKSKQTDWNYVQPFPGIISIDFIYFVVIVVVALRQGSRRRVFGAGCCHQIERSPRSQGPWPFLQADRPVSPIGNSGRFPRLRQHSTSGNLCHFRNCLIVPIRIIRLRRHRVHISIGQTWHSGGRHFIPNKWEEASIAQSMRWIDRTVQGERR